MKTGKVISTVLLAAAMLIMFSVSAFAGSTPGGGINFSNAAYYDVSWGEIVVSENTEGYHSMLEGDWADVCSVRDRDADAKIFNCRELADTMKPNITNSLIWYGWVAEDGYWRGHLYGVPTVTNTVTGNKVAVTSWEVTVEHTGEYRQTTLDYLGRWSTSGTGSVIDVDSVPANMQQVKSHKQGATSDPDTRYRFLAVRLYLADGNSIYLSYYSEGSGMTKPDAVTALGGRATGTYWSRYTEGPNIAPYKSGNSYISAIYLNTPDSVKEYHFAVEKTVTDAADDAAYTFPVRISISNGAEMTVGIETIGNGTFRKEISFRAYEGTYSVIARESTAEMPKGVQIVTGWDSGTAVLSDVVITDAATLSLENKIGSGKYPETGDSTNSVLLFVLMCVSVSGIFFTTRYGKKRKSI